MNNTFLIKEAKAWVKPKNGPGVIIRVMPDMENDGTVLSYHAIHPPLDPNPDYLGRILFDAQGYWIYDGELLILVTEQELTGKIHHQLR